jgi:hypothetical protein
VQVATCRLGRTKCEALVTQHITTLDVAFSSLHERGWHFPRSHNLRLLEYGADSGDLFLNLEVMQLETQLAICQGTQGQAYGGFLSQICPERAMFQDICLSALGKGGWQSAVGPFAAREPSFVPDQLLHESNTNILSAEMWLRKYETWESRVERLNQD